MSTRRCEARRLQSDTLDKGDAYYAADLCAEASESVATAAGTTDEIGNDQAQRSAVAFYRGIGFLP